MHQTAPVGADVHVHAEVPLPALARLLHLRVALTGGVLGRRRRGNEGGIDDGAALEQQLLFFQQRAYLGKQLLGQPVLLQQVTKAQDGGLVRHQVSGQIKAGKPPHRLAVVQRVFHGRIGQVEPLLHKVDA
jgi:hypothetical protein